MRKLKATNQINEDTYKKKIELGRRLQKELSDAVDEDSTLRELDAKYIAQNLERWGVWPLDRI